MNGRVAGQLVQSRMSVTVQGCLHREHVVPQRLAQAVEGIQLDGVKNMEFTAGTGRKEEGAFDSMARRRLKIGGDEESPGCRHSASSFMGASINGW